MTADELANVITGVAPVVREYVAGQLSLYDKRLETMEARPVVHGRDGKDGRDADVSDVLALKAEIASLQTQLQRAKDDVPLLVKTAIDEALAGLRVPQDGKDGQSVSVEDVAPLIAAEVATAVAAIPVPKDGEPGTSVDEQALKLWLHREVADAVGALPKAKDGQSVTLEDVAPLIASEVERAVTALPPARDGQDGRSVTVEEIAPLISAEVTKAVAAIPIPKDGAPGQPGAPGTSVDIGEIEALVVTHVEKAVHALPTPKDGTSIAGALIDREGHLILTFSDGVSKDVGPVLGKDVDMREVTRLVTDELNRWPRPKDGEPGPAGRDGTLENLKAAFDGERTVTLCFKDGTPIDGGVVKFNVVLYRGVYVEGKTYEAGDQVTWAGSSWIAQTTTTAKPGQVSVDSRAWILAVKAGRDGKPGQKGDKGEVVQASKKDGPKW